MKKLALLLFLLFGINISHADGIMCAMSDMSFYPQQKEISLSSMFIIEGYAMSQETINSFKTREVFLESDKGELIQLQLQKILKGQMRLTQAILKPVTSLKPYTTYFLKYANQTKKETKEMTRYNRYIKKHEKVIWKTLDRKFAKPISSTLNITFDDTGVAQFGCGPAVSANFIIKNNPESEVWYKTEFVDLLNSKKTTYYLRSYKDQLSVGHGMCAGAFTYSGEGKYKVRFTAINIDGKSIKTTNWKVFDSPYKGYEKGF